MANNTPIEVQDNTKPAGYTIFENIHIKHMADVGYFGWCVWSQLKVLAHNSDNDTVPSHDYLAKKIGCSVSSVRNGIRDLKSAGWLEVQPRYNGTGGQTSNLYILHGRGGIIIKQGGSHNKTPPLSQYDNDQQLDDQQLDDQDSGAAGAATTEDQDNTPPAGPEKRIRSNEEINPLRDLIGLHVFGVDTTNLTPQQIKKGIMPRVAMWINAVDDIDQTWDLQDLQNFLGCYEQADQIVPTVPAKVKTHWLAWITSGKPTPAQAAAKKQAKDTHNTYTDPHSHLEYGD